MNIKAPARGIWLASLLMAAWVPVAQAAGADTAACAAGTSYEQLRGAMLASNGRTPLAPLTMVLPPDGNARVVFHQALSDGAENNSFRIFETDAPQGSGIHVTELSVISVAPVAADVVDGFTPADSVQLQFKISSHLLPLWGNRHFVVVACSGGAFKAWGEIVARVSNPNVAYAFCTFVALLMYFLAMTAIWGWREAQIKKFGNDPDQPGLPGKYPALFGAKELFWYDFFNPIHLTENAFHQASVQKLQVLLFSFLIGWLLLSLVLRTGALVDLSPTVIGLLGISGIGAVTAQIAYQQKTRLSFVNWAWLEKKQVLKIPAQNELTGPQWKDLVLTNREFDVYKLQTIIFSIAVAAAMVVAGASALSSFTVPDTLLGLLGLSQVVYVGGVLVKPAAVGDLDTALTQLRLAGETVAAAKLQKTDTGPDGKLLKDLPDKQPVAANAQRQYDDLADSIIPMLESALEIQADRSKL